jgi:hypothetical protein
MAVPYLLAPLYTAQCCLSEFEIVVVVVVVAEMKVYSRTLHCAPQGCQTKQDILSELKTKHSCKQSVISELSNVYVALMMATGWPKHVASVVCF